MDCDFIQPMEFTFGQKFKKVSLFDLQNYKHHPKVIVLFKFPYDEGTKRNNGRQGGENGPEKFMDTLNSLKIYSNFDDVAILDLGQLQKELQLHEAHEQLYQVIAEVYHQLPQSYLIMVGGSNDQSYPNFKGLVDGTQCKDISIINIDAHFDVRPLKDGLPHSGSPFRLALEDERFQGKMIEFGNKGQVCAQSHYDYVKQKGGDVYFMEKDIRRKFNTATECFEKVISDLKSKYIFVSFDIDSINSAWCPGVSAPSIGGGLTNQEALDICYISGKNSQVKLFDMSEFNPAIESERTSTLMVQMVYQFIKGKFEK